MEYPEIAAAIEELDRKFNGKGRVLIRPSGTEPKIKFYYGVRGTSLEDSQKKLDELGDAVMKLFS